MLVYIASRSGAANSLYVCTYTYIYTHISGHKNPTMWQKGVNWTVYVQLGSLDNARMEPANWFCNGFYLFNAREMVSASSSDNINIALLRIINC